ncbi:SIS domain-containing protein [Paenibacillus roseipurpureus]|uniref:Glutamine--fructose-6-phosphate aminotransferase [isomerizing] n=1 Tax=Paenibacillus roseopurpureus TaxID=2918901 RepID=A0AA96RLT4_9BACL|nr:SIS domain-containing protein [Paenibacillus sp. MBLB1832]WNR46010.1 SIS domain-containing protein [Paenibacillus sp. MBLB1832]
MNRYEEDVIGQTACVRGALDTMLEQVTSSNIAEMKKKTWSKVVFAGMGSSHFVCHGAVIHLIENGIDARVLSASELLHYEMGLIDENTLLVLVSQSGESAEIVRLIERLPSHFSIFAITNEPASTLAIRAQWKLILHVEREQSVTTRTYLASLVAVHLLARELSDTMHEADFKRDMREALVKMDHVLQNHSLRQKLNGFIEDPPYLCLIGRGYSLSTVRAGALFIREVAKYPALDFDAAEFRHGPMEMVDGQFTAIVFAPAGVTAALNLKLALDIAERGGKAVLIINEMCDIVHPNILVIPLPPVHEVMSPLLDVIPVQWIANELAVRRQLEVGAFRWSSKVTSKE